MTMVDMVMETPLLDAGPDVYYNDERGYDAVERAAPARDYEDYYDEEGYGDYGTEGAVAADGC